MTSFSRINILYKSFDLFKSVQFIIHKLFVLIKYPIFKIIFFDKVNIFSTVRCFSLCFFVFFLLVSPLLFWNERKSKSPTVDNLLSYQSFLKKILSSFRRSIVINVPKHRCLISMCIDRRQHQSKFLPSCSMELSVAFAMRTVGACVS